MPGPTDMVPPPDDDEPGIRDPWAPDGPGRPLRDPPAQPMDDLAPRLPGGWRVTEVVLHPRRGGGVVVVVGAARRAD